MFVEILSYQKEKSLSVVQFRTEKQNTFDYISGPTAVQKGFLTIEEINDNGSVNSISVYNNSRDFIFFMDGDILTGAKQNRVLNTSVLISPNSHIVIPVSCVEKGRWNFTTPKFDISDYSAPHKFRAKKSQEIKNNLEQCNEFICNQSRVWRDIDQCHAKFNIESETSNLSDIFNKNEEDFSQLAKHFNVEKEANGICTFINEKLLNIEIFNRTDIYVEYFSKILKGAAFDAYNLHFSANQMTEEEASIKVNLFLEQIEYLTPSIHNGVGCGIEKRYSNQELTGFELNFAGHLIHLTLLNLVN